MTAQCIGIVGRRRTGKDAAANYLVDNFGYVRVGFADALKRAALALDPWVEYGEDEDRYPVAWRLSEVVAEIGWEHAKDQHPEVRRILQHLGDEAGRQVHGEDTWVSQAMAEITRHRLCGRPVVVPDVRYSNEVNALREAGFTVVRLNRATVKHTESVDSHSSESGTDNLQVDGVIPNNGTLLEFSASIRKHLAL